MAKVTATALMEKRRSIVGALIARGLHASEIHEMISQPELIEGDAKTLNPFYIVRQNQKPFTLQTIYNDIEYLTLKSREQIAATIEHHRANQFSKLLEAQRQAWRDGNLASLARFIELEMKLLGTPMPDKVENRFDEEQLEMITRLTEARDTIQQRLKQLAERQAPAEVSD